MSRRTRQLSNYAATKGKGAPAFSAAARPLTRDEEIQSLKDIIERQSQRLLNVEADNKFLVEKMELVRAQSRPSQQNSSDSSQSVLAQLLKGRTPEEVLYLIQIGTDAKAKIRDLESRVAERDERIRLLESAKREAVINYNRLKAETAKLTKTKVKK